MNQTKGKHEKETKDIVPKQDAPLAVVSATDIETAFGGLDATHVNVPRLVVLEGLSPEVAREKLGTPGDLFVKGLNRNLGSNPLEVVVLMRFHSRIFWKGLKNGGGILCQSFDGKRGEGEPGGDCAACTKKDWGIRPERNDPSDKKPECSEYENFLVVLRSDLQAGEAFPMVVGGTGTRLKGLRDWNTMLMQLYQRRLPPFAKSYLLKPVAIETEAGFSHVLRAEVGNGNALLPEEEQKAAYSLFTAFKGKRVVVDQADERVSTQTADTPAF